MRNVITQLEGLRRRGWIMLLAQRIALLLAAAVVVTIALVLLDYALRLPSWFRAALLAAGIATLIVGAWRFVLPAMRFRPTLTQLALRIERVLPSLSGRLASSIEFAVSGVDQTNTMAARSVRDAQSRLVGESMSRFIQPRQTVRGLALLLLAAVLASFFLFGNPAAAQTGLARLFVPFGDAKWPARTGVESLMNEVLGERGVHPRGRALTLRAHVTRGDLGQRIDARYRVRTDDTFGPWQHVVLTQQGATAVHERLIEPAGDAIEVYFISHDDETHVERITIVTPPAVRRASLTVTPPEYAAHLSPFEAELGPGIDSRAQTETASLIGSHVRLDLYLNKTLPVPSQPQMNADERRFAWLKETFDWDDESELPHFSVDPDQPARWTLQWTLDRTRSLPVHLVDEYGLTSGESIAYRIDAVADSPPAVTITQPQADEAVLPSALVPLTAEAQDDVGVTHLALQAHHQRSEGEGASDHPIWSAQRAPAPAPSSTASLRGELDLATLSLRQGDVVIVTALAADGFIIDEEARPPTVSAPRRLRIISELEMEEMIRRQLGAVRQSAIRMEAQQAELQEAVAERGADQSTERAQAQLSERIAAQREAVAQLNEQLRGNRMDNPQIESLLNQSADLLDHAGRASNEAAAAMNEQSRLGRTPERDRDVQDHQQEVRAELSDLIELLDRDEDTWVVTRRLEGLMREQADLQEAADALGERTMGRSLDELSQPEMTDLDRIAQRQRELRDRARELADELRQRADQLEPVDPRAAAGMRDAARTAEQRELDRDMEQAAQRVEQNQMTSAQQSQQNAADTLQRMLEDIQQTQQARAEELLRQLASLVQSIERLIVVQENELIALANARHRENFSGRDHAMIRLHQNTQAVAAEARALGQQPAQRRIARTLDRAADAQSTAITSLRARPIQVDDAEDAENRSLELLQEAKALAEELEQQTQEDESRRRREELIQAYRDFAEKQVVLREETLELQKHEELDRRGLVEARRIGSQQDQIRTGLLDLQRATQEIMDSMIFSHVHSRIDGWARQVSESLDAGDAGVRTTNRQQQIAEAIGHLIHALEEEPPPPQEFDQGEQQQGGEGGGGAQPLIPPVAELRLLRGMQEHVYNQTRALDGRSDLADTELQDMLREVGSQQRELIEIGRVMLEALERNAPPPPPQERPQ